MNISYSSYEKWSTCEKLWQLHYIDKIRPNSTTSALFFGGAVGQVWQALALSKKEDLTTEEKKEVERAKDWKKMFHSLLHKVQIEYQNVEPTDPRVFYYKGDWDSELLNQGDWIELDNYANKLGLILPNGNPLAYDDLEPRYPFGLTQDEIRYMNLHYFLSLGRKGEMMIESFIKDILPNIVKVYAIEKPLKIDMSLESAKPMTDVLTGFMDMVCDFRVTDAKLAGNLGIEIGSVVKVLFDNKTSSTRYGSKCLEEKPQLNIYNYCESSDYIGYLVAVKEIKRPKIGVRKGEVFADIQVVLGKSSETISNAILDGVNTMLDSVSKNEFKPNYDVCTRVYGRKCPMYDYCKNGDMTGLVKK